MHTRTSLMAATAAAILALAGCASSTQPPSSTPTTTEPGTMSPSAMVQDCIAVPGDSFVVLADDKQLQNADNLIPAVYKVAATPALLDALNAVSAVLDTPQLIQLNKSVDIDRMTSVEVAKTYVADKGIASPSAGTGTIVVGAANFSENITVAEIYAEVLRNAGFDASVQTIGNRETYLPALEKGDIQVVPEYAATVTEYLNRDQNGADAATVASGDVTATVAALAPLADAAGLVFGDPSAAQDQNAFAVTAAFSDAYGVTSLSDLAANCGPITLGGPPECPERPFCQLGLEDKYGLEVEAFSSLDAGGPLTKTAIQQGKVAVGLVFSSDGSLG